MKILLVDDEPLVLSGLKRGLFDTDWEIFSASCGEEALMLVATHKPDVVISDMLMPNMNGTELLDKVHTLHPGIVRVVLSGHADEDASLHAGFVAHQWLDKPCTAEVLREFLIRVEAGLERFPNSEIKAIVGSTNTLPSPPKTFFAIHELQSSGKANAESMTEIISKDPALSAKILQLTNSSFFFRGTKISTVKNAIVRLGGVLVNNVILVSETYAKSEENKAWDASQDQLYGLVVSKLVGEMLDDDTREDAIIAGLLHEVGKSILASVFPEKIEDYKALLLNHSGCELMTQERALFDTGYAQIGGYLLYLWGFPDAIVESVLDHCDEVRICEGEFGAAAAIYVANALVHGYAVSDVVIERFGLQDKLASWIALTEKLLEKERS